MAAMSSRIGANIRKQRADQGYTIESFAQAVGVSWVTVSRWERGVTIPRDPHLLVIAQTLGVPLTDLITGQAA